MRQFFAAFGLVVVLLPFSAFAQSPTISFQARVTSANGPDAAVFSAGDAVSISYTLDTNVADVNADPQAGIFHGAAQSLSVSFPTLGVSAVGSSGTVQTFDNFVSGLGGETSDQVFVFGGPISSASLLAGNEIDGVEVDFLSAFLPPPDVPTMLSSDAIPTFLPAYAEAFAILHTINGWTFVNFEVAGPTVHMTANGSHGPVTLAPGDALTIDIQFDAPGTGLASGSVAAGVASPFGVFWLGPAGFSATPVALYSGPLSDFGPATLFNFPSIAAFPPGSYRWFMLVYDGASSAVGVDVVETILP